MNAIVERPSAAQPGRARGVLKNLVSGRSGVATVVQNFGVSVSTLGANLITGMIVARALGPTGRGEQAAIGMWVVFFSALSTIGIPEALRYRSRQHPELRGQLLSAATWAAIGCGIAAAVIGALLIPVLMHRYTLPFVREAQLLMVFAPAFVLILVQRGFLESQNAFRRSNAAILAISGSTIVALLILLALHRLTPFTAPVAYVIPTALVVAILWIVMRKNRRSGDAKQCFGLLTSYGWRIYGSEIFRAFSTQIDQALILMFLTPHSLGLYAVALTVSRTIMLISQSTWAVVFARVAGQSPEEVIPLALRGARITMGISACAAALFIAAQPVLIPLVYGRAFSAAVPLAGILTVEATFVSVALMLSVSFAAMGRPFVSTITQGSWLALTIVLLFVLVPRLHELGAAVALLGASTSRLVLLCFLYRIVLGQPFPVLIPNREDIAYLRARARLVR